MGVKYKFKVVNREKWREENAVKVINQRTIQLDNGEQIHRVHIQLKKPIPPAKQGTCGIKSIHLFGPYVLDDIQVSI